MRVTVDPHQLSQTATPLRAGTDAARDLHRSTYALLGSIRLGQPDVEAAVADFVRAWGDTLDSAARQGETLARMLDLAGSGSDAGGPT